MTRLTTGAVVLGAACMLLPARLFSLPAFTDEQKQKLEAGELVKVPSGAKKSAGYTGGKSYILLGESIDACYKAMADIKNYYFFYDDTLIEAKVLTSEGDARLIKMTYGKGPVKMSYHAAYKLNAKNHTITYKLDKSLPNDLDDATGAIKFAQYDEKRVLMTNVVLVDFGDSVVSKLFGGKIANGMLKLPKYLKNFFATPAAAKYR